MRPRLLLAYAKTSPRKSSPKPMNPLVGLWDSFQNSFEFCGRHLGSVKAIFCQLANELPSALGRTRSAAVNDGGFIAFMLIVGRRLLP